VSYF